MNSSTVHQQVFIPSLHVQVTRYIQVASLTLVLYDHLLTLRNEIELVWLGAKTRFSWPRLLFFSARYACPAALIVNSFALLGTDVSDQLGWLFFHGWSGYVFFSGVQVISQLRLWAMYRSKKLLVIMTIFLGMALISMAVIEGFGFSHVTVTAIPGPKGVHICGPGELPHFVYAFWFPPIIVETVSVILVVYKAVLHFREYTPREWSGSRLMSSIVRHSVLYFVIVLAAYLANFCIWLRLPINAFELVVPLTYALPSVAGNRMLLSLRSIFHSKRTSFPDPDDTSICLTFFHPDPEITVQVRRHNRADEFNSYFGEILQDGS